MLYELVALTRISSPLHLNQEAKQVANTIGKLIIENRGVVRKVYSLGAKPLPRIVKKENEKHFQSYNFMMLFDASSSASSEVARAMKADPRVIRGNIIKVQKENDFFTNQFSIDRVADPSKRYT
ncbi:hypothetical protein BABINDRAFT_159353 [Babjeviella inositovora NRRL Y-12698]|uniref:Ribosomal protein S6 n=1 Tax=Babjeviella inositovora NRRL Y-12698 TaxID=984486 RepID=A0A1E3QYZ6_9ASCO|nr:uncharacterized protein BABINDRAFT_159353 [Babjeviella inositovora NRRL Y-12698]ODQ82856.1 hypothetical protein BABINDRAFT_159353 [Babjeviella inositovora NRRL Y-12698]